MEKKEFAYPVRADGRWQFLGGARYGDYVFVFYRDPLGSIRNQTKAFRADGSDVETLGSVIYNEDVLQGVRLKRAWAKDLPKSMQDAFCCYSGVLRLQDLVWAPGQEPAPEESRTAA